MNRSSKFNFFLPQNTDPIEVSDFNSNFETIDANLLTKAQSLTDAQKAAVRENVDLNVANNLTTTAAGSVLDARQGKALKDSIDEVRGLINVNFVVKRGSIAANTQKQFTVANNTRAVIYLIAASIKAEYIVNCTSNGTVSYANVGGSENGITITTATNILNITTTVNTDVLIMTINGGIS